jgi:hypothetical protein
MIKLEIEYKEKMMQNSISPQARQAIGLPDNENQKERKTGWFL